jgi:hypothetical protein
MTFPAHQLAASWTARLPEIAAMLKQGGSSETAALKELSAMMSAVSDYRAVNPYSSTFEPLMRSIWQLLS